MVNNQLVRSYLKRRAPMVKVVDLNGKPVRELALPGIGTVGGFSGKRGDGETFYSFTSFTTPTTIYRYDMKSRQEQRVSPAEGRLRSERV
jgi:prolyl oligopeptidase